MAIEVAALSLIDRLIQLLTLKEKNREKFFNTLIEPLYKDAEPVAKDYMVLLSELAHRIEDRPIKETLAWLEEKRAAYQPVRMKLRALLENPAYSDSATWVRTPLERFTLGIWRLMTGGLAVTNMGEYVTMPEYGYQGHTILDIARRMRVGIEAGESGQERRELLREVRGQQVAIEHAWHDVVMGYAELKQQNL